MLIIVPIVEDYYGLLEVAAQCYYKSVWILYIVKLLAYILCVQHRLIVLYCGSVAVCSFVYCKNTFGGMLLHYIYQYIWLQLAGVLTYTLCLRKRDPDLIDCNFKKD